MTQGVGARLKKKIAGSSSLWYQLADLWGQAIVWA